MPNSLSSHKSFSFRRHITSLLFLISVLSGYSLLAQQNVDRALADQYFNGGEYEKAVDAYSRLSDTDPFGIYPNYFKSLLAIKDYDGAEKLARKMGKKMPTHLSYQADIGYVYQLRGERAKAEEYYSKALKALKPDQGMILILANAYVVRQDWSHALEVYVTGQRMLSGIYGFHFETAEAYYQKGEMEQMLEEYLDAVQENDANQQSVQNILQFRIGYDPENGRADLLRTALLRRIQRFPEQTVFSDMLIWLFIQQKNFDMAGNQARALDKRMKEDGSRLISIASMAAANRQYDAAIRCYQYVLSKGTDCPNYVIARMELLNVSNRKLTESNTYTDPELKQLEQDYLVALTELGRSARTAGIVRGLAHLRAFYLDNPDSAIADLDEAIAFAGISRQVQADCKLELADILLFEGNVWDSDLLYAQVDKDFKNDPLGQEAKFRSARLDYFRGDFLWAQAQLDVLKSATSQLIANDALALSLLISDNMGLDSSTEALTLYAQADLFRYRNRDAEALVMLDSLLSTYPDHSLTDDSWFLMAQIMDYRRNWQVEDSLYMKIVAMGEESVLADDALYRRAQLYEEKFSDKAKAMELYQDLITRFPGSLYVVDARKRFRSLRGDLSN